MSRDRRIVEGWNGISDGSRPRPEETGEPPAGVKVSPSVVGSVAPEAELPR